MPRLLILSLLAIFVILVTVSPFEIRKRDGEEHGRWKRQFHPHPDMVGTWENPPPEIGNWDEPPLEGNPKDAPQEGEDLGKAPQDEWSVGQSALGGLSEADFVEEEGGVEEGVEKEGSEEDTQTVEEQLRDLQQQMADLNLAVAELQAADHSDPIVFSVRRSTKYFPPTRTGYPLRFNMIQSNDRGGYNTLSGKFTAPEPGHYVFIATLLVQHTGFDIWLDGTAKPVTALSSHKVNGIQQLTVATALVLNETHHTVYVSPHFDTGDKSTGAAVLGEKGSVFVGFRVG